jgi:Flp pilus assembly protein TadD
MIYDRYRVALIGMALATLVCVASIPAMASSSDDASVAAKAVSDQSISNIQHALDEQRYVDAGNLLNQVLIGGAKGPRIDLLVGELSLARSNYSDALASFASIEANPAVRGEALQGEGIALSNLGRSSEARVALEKAVAVDPSLWRAWNALGTEYDKQRDWPRAEAAYDHALANSDSTAIALNNRGFSLLLQKRLDEASADFVAALQKKPDLAPARTNLRLAIAMKGDYNHAIAGGSQDGQAALLNNAGVAAMVHGDYAQAEKLFGQAIKAKGEYYARAEANLEITHDLEAQGNASATSTPHNTIAQ